MDRRQALKRGVAAGAVAWTAPAVLGQTVSAADGTCTPKCVPVGTPQFTATLQDTCGAVYTVIVVPVLQPGSVRCPCGGTPVVNGSQLVRRFPRRFRGNADITGSVTIRCSDNAGDPCDVTCTLTVTVNITGNPGNDCAQTDVTLVRVVANC